MDGIVSVPASFNNSRSNMALIVAGTACAVAAYTAYKSYKNEKRLSSVEGKVDDIGRAADALNKLVPTLSAVTQRANDAVDRLENRAERASERESETRPTRASTTT